jgi:hypothetical protein
VAVPWIIGAAVLLGLAGHLVSSPARPRSASRGHELLFPLPFLAVESARYRARDEDQCRRAIRADGSDESSVSEGPS